MPNLGEMGGAVGALLKEKNQTIAIAETSAGGLISAALLSVPGASAYYMGGGVLYTYESRSRMLALPEDAFGGMRPSTEEYARALARAARAHLGADWALSETGAAGPKGNRYGDDPGHSCIAVAGPAGASPAEAAATLETGSADREANMWAFAAAGLALLEKTIRG